MTLPDFELFRPKDLGEALKWLAANRSRRVKIIAGGTDLLVDMRNPVIPDGHKPPLDRQPEGIWQARSHKRDRPEALCALWTLPELKGIRHVGRRMCIGALTTITEIEESPLIRERLTGLADGAAQLGSALVRNRGTFGGNLCNARPAADMAIPTLALGGRVTLESVQAKRVLPLEQFILGPGRTVIEPDEILTVVEFDLPETEESEYLRSAYIKLAQRKSLEISVVGAAAALRFDAGGVITSARIALGAVAPTPVLAVDASAQLFGARPTHALIAAAAATAAAGASPITDHRAGRDYRRAMIEILVRRVLSCCLQDAPMALEGAPA